jgi:N-acetylglutamate synthase-like GNAT family acetyltransferase
VANAFYSPDILAAWSEKLGKPETISKHEAAIASGAEFVLVAEADGRLMAFGAIIPGTGELRAVYVAAAAKRSGVGSLILAALEAEARRLGIADLHMDASLSAVNFYRAKGFQEIERKQHRFESGAEMDCVAMRKVL